MLNRRRFVLATAATLSSAAIARPLAAQTPSPAASPAATSMMTGLKYGFTRSYRPESGIERISVGIAVLESEELAKELYTQKIESLKSADAELKVEEGTEYGEENVVMTQTFPAQAKKDVYWHEGVFAVFITANGKDEASVDELIMPFVEFVAGQELKDEAYTFNEDGTSTGGIFDAMPAKESDVAKPYTKIEDSGMMGSE